MVTLILSLVFVGAENTIMAVEADIIDMGEDNNETGTISIQVPEFIDLDGVNENGVSEELKIYMNNTGTVAITVTPMLSNYTDEIFDHLYFREFKTSGGDEVTPQQIGEWSMNISAPASGQTFRSKYFYMQLDLSEADIDISNDLLGHQARVKFLATAR